MIGDNDVFYDIEKTAERIRRLRKQKKCTQEELAEELNIDRSVLSRIEIGKYTCSIEFLAQVSDFFGVPLDYLVFGRVGARDTAQLKNSITELIQRLEHFKEQI